MSNTIRPSFTPSRNLAMEPRSTGGAPTGPANPTVLGRVDADTLERVQTERPELLSDGLITRDEASALLEQGDGERILGRDLLQKFASAGPGSAVASGEVVYTSKTTAEGDDALNRQVTDNFEPVSGNHTDPRGAAYRMKDVVYTEQTESNRGTKEMGDGSEQAERSFSVEHGVHQTGAQTPTGEQVRFQGVGNTPEEAIMNGLSNTVRSHGVHSETVTKSQSPDARAFERDVLGRADATKDTFEGAPRVSNGAYTETANGTNQSRNQIAADIIEQGGYRKGTGAKLPNGERVAFTAGRTNGRDTQAGQDFARLARDTGVAPGAQDLESARQALNAGPLKDDPISQDKGRIGAEYTTGLQDAVVSRFNGVAEVAHDASQVVRPDGQVDRQALAAFRAEYSDDPAAQEIFQKAGIEGGPGAYKGTIDEMGRLQEAARGTLGEMGEALDPEQNAFAAHPNLQALRGRISDITERRVIIQPVPKEELAQHVVSDTSSQSKVGGSEFFSSVRARVVQSTDQDGNTFYTAVGRAERGTVQE